VPAPDRFANIVLADEINRTPPKMQSKLPDMMQEHTIHCRTYELTSRSSVRHAEPDRARGHLSAGP
jgi:MoxR-like ATPase